MAVLGANAGGNRGQGEAAWRRLLGSCARSSVLPQPLRDHAGCVRFGVFLNPEDTLMDRCPHEEVPLSIACRGEDPDVDAVFTKVVPALLALIAMSIPGASMAQELDVKSLKIRGVAGLKAVDVLVSRPNEPKATYKVVAIGKGPEGSVVSINTRYSDASGWVYTTRAVKCDSGRMKTLGSGETVEGMLKSKADLNWGPLVGGSSATQVAEIACAQSGKRLSGVQ